MDDVRQEVSVVTREDSSLDGSSVRLYGGAKGAARGG
jgi:hypothetical protein